MSAGLLHSMGRVFRLWAIVGALAIASACATPPESQGGGAENAQATQSVASNPAKARPRDDSQNTQTKPEGAMMDEAPFDTDESEPPPAISDKSERRARSEAVWRRFSNESLDEMKGIFTVYLTELKAAGWMDILNPERLSQDRDLSQSRKIIADTEALQNQYKKRVEAQLKHMSESIDKLDLDIDTRKARRAEFDGAIRQFTPIINDAWNLSSTVLKEVKLIVKLMASRPGEWSAHGYFSITFKRAQDQNKVNKHMDAIQKASLRAMQLMEFPAPLFK